MRVAVHAGQLRQPVPGGIARYVRELLRALPGAGVEAVPFATAGPPGTEPAFADWVDLGWPRGSARYELWHRLRRPVVDLAGTELVHATSLAVAPAGPRPLVVTVHDLVFLRSPELLTGRGVRFHRRGLDLARREAAAVITPTAAVADQLVAEGFDRDRLFVAHHGVTVGPEPSVADGDDVLRRLGVTAPFVLFVGTFEPRKGLDDLLFARAGLGSVELVLAGSPGWGEAPPTAGDGVVVAERPADADLDVLYRRAAALALPSRDEGFGLPLVEAMARGCPVVHTDVAALNEVAGDAGTAVAVGDIEALTSALDRLVVDPEWRDDRAAAARNRARHFTWASSAAAHAQAYAAAAAR